ncbi:MAG: hypothetical protein M0T74_05500 [Desulfitobacterium hafniense]|nr:hypothetical protein [Desulfitobacterium hafniense]
MSEPIIRYLSQQELEELYQKYGKPGEFAPGIPAKRSKNIFFRSAWGKR